MIRKLAGLAALMLASAVQAGNITLNLDGGLGGSCTTFSGLNIDANGNATVTGTGCTGAGTGPYSVNATVTPSAGGSIALDVTPPVVANTTVTATLSRNAGYTVTGWTGVTCTAGGGTSDTCTFTVTGNTTVNANVSNGASANYTVTATASGGSASFSYSPTGASYAAGTNVTVTATVLDGSTITGWTGCPSPSGATCTINNIQQNVALTLNLQPPAGNCGTPPAGTTIIQTTAQAQAFPQKTYSPAPSTINAFKFTTVATSGTSGTAYMADTTSSKSTGRYMVISECPGSRTTVNSQSACARELGVTATVPYFAGGGSARYCQLQTSKTYYVNIFNTYADGSPGCSNSTECAYYFDMK